MASEKPVDVNLLTLWKARHAALGRLIESYEEAERIGALGGLFETGDGSGLISAGVGSVSGSATALGAGIAMTSTELPVGAFLNMSIPEAIKLYLSAVKRKQTLREIANALKEGGMESTSANWETTVTGSLHRLKAAGAVLKFKDGWGLADFYPESLRARIAKEEKPRRKARRSKKVTTPPTKTRRIELEEVESKAS